MDKMQKYYEDFFKHGGSIKEVPKEYRTKEMCEKHISQGGTLRYVPERFITQAMCNEYISRGGGLLYIPEKFITQEMCNGYVLRGGNLLYVPKQFITQEMCNEYIFRGGNLGYVPSEFMTREMCGIYFQNHSLREVAKNYMTQEMCNEYISQGGDLWVVPEQFKTQELYNLYISQGGDLRNVPEQFITQEMCNEYISQGGDLWNVPDRFITQEMCEKHISQGGTLGCVPVQFKTQELYNLYISRGGDLWDVPEQFITQEMCVQYLLNGGRIAYVPKQFQTPEIIAFYLDLMIKKYNLQYLKLSTAEEKAENIFKSLLIDDQITLHGIFDYNSIFDYIPYQYISKTMTSNYLKKKQRGLNSSQEKDLIKDFYINLFNRTQNVNFVPEEYLTEEMIEFAKKNYEKVKTDSDVWQFIERQQKKEQTERQIERELYNLPQTLKTLVQLADEYGVNISFIKRLLDKMKDKYPEQYNEIQKVLNDNSLRFKHNMIQSIKKMSVIIDSLGEIDYNSKIRSVGKYAKKLNEEQQIKFSYLLVKSGIQIKILHEIYEALDNDWIVKDTGMEETEIAKIRSFFEILYVDVKKENFANLSDSEKYAVLKSKSSQYLRKYNPKEYFYDAKTRGATKHSVIDKNDNIVKITEENSKVVIEILMDYDIPLSNAIVKEAFRLYFREGAEGLTKFISQLQAYDLTVQKAKEYAGDYVLDLENTDHKATVIPLSEINENENRNINLYDGNITGFGMKRR